MTTFVPLAADTDGTASAVAVGEWLLHLITVYDAEDKQRTKEYYREFMSCFSRDEEAGETKITNPNQLLSLLLQQSQIAFKFLEDIKLQQDTTNQDSRQELKKSYTDALKEVEDFYLLLISLVVLRIKDDELAGQMAGSFCSVFRNSTQLPEFRLRLLMGLYNVFPPSFPYRFPIFVSILEYALETNLFHVLLPYVKYINEWTRDWNLSRAANRQVFLMLSTGLKQLNMTEEAFDYLKRHIQFFQGEPEDVLLQESTISASIELIVDSVRMPDILYFDVLLNLDAIKILNKTKHSPLFKLLQIFSRGGPEDLEEIKKTFPTIFDDYGLDYSVCLKKLCLLSVASRMQHCREITFRQIGDGLKLTEQQAEEVVVEAIGLGLVNAKVDQINRIIYIKTAIQREFDTGEWKGVLKQLDHWISGVRTLRQTIENIKNNPESSVPSPVSTFN